MNKFGLIVILLSLISIFSCNDDKYITQPPITVKWTNTGLRAKDVGVGSEGDIYAAATDGKLYIYKILTNSFTVKEGDFDLPRVSRVDADADGTPYVITKEGGQVYYLDCLNKWIRLPGCAKDIGVGRGGEVWKVGCDARLGGFGIWKLFCNGDAKCNCFRQCTRFRTFKYSPVNKQESKSCFWYRIEGGGVRLDVDNNGYPWIVSDNNTVYYYDKDDSNWRPANGFLARDISVSNDGNIFAAGLNSKIARLICPNLGTWQILSGAASSLSVGPYNLPTIVDGASMVYTTVKRSTN